VVISLACSHAQEAANNLMKHDETACGAHIAAARQRAG